MRSILHGSCFVPFRATRCCARWVGVLRTLSWAWVVHSWGSAPLSASRHKTRSMGMPSPAQLSVHSTLWGDGIAGTLRAALYWRYYPPFEVTDERNLDCC